MRGPAHQGATASSENHAVRLPRTQGGVVSGPVRGPLPRDAMATALVGLETVDASPNGRGLAPRQPIPRGLTGRSVHHGPPPLPAAAPAVPAPPSAPTRSPGS